MISDCEGVYITENNLIYDSVVDSSNLDTISDDAKNKNTCMNSVNTNVGKSYHPEICYNASTSSILTCMAMHGLEFSWV